MNQPQMFYGVPPRDCHPRQTFMIFTTKRGWCEARWHQGYGCLQDVDRHIPEAWRMIPPDQVQWWMTQNGGPIR